MIDVVVAGLETSVQDFPGRFVRVEWLAFWHGGIVPQRTNNASTGRMKLDRPHRNALGGILCDRY